ELRGGVAVGARERDRVTRDPHRLLDVFGWLHRGGEAGHHAGAQGARVRGESSERARERVDQRPVYVDEVIELTEREARLGDEGGLAYVARDREPAAPCLSRFLGAARGRERAPPADPAPHPCRSVGAGAV